MQWRIAAHWPTPHGFTSLLSYRFQDYQPKGGTSPSELAPPMLIICQANAIKPCPQASLMGDIVSVEVFSSLMTLACVKLM